jgi:hypothetical protein
MKNKILYIIAIIIVVFISFFIFKKVSFAPKAEIPEENIATTTVEKTGTSTPIKTKEISIKDTAWAVFQKYLAYNKEKNLDGVKSIVFKVNPVCADKVASEDCKNRMDSAYQYGSALKKEDFKNVWSDEKQIILATNFWTESSTDLDEYGRFRSIMFFIKGSDGQWKLLSFSPTKGNATNKGAASQKEIDDRLVRYTEDKDQDGIADYAEECLQTQDKSTCIVTSPKLRDTDGNGLWDGVQALMK